VTGRRAAALALGFVFLVAGCSAAPVDDAGPAISPQQSQAEFLALLDEAATLAGGEWETRDSPSPLSCELPGSGGDGVTFTGRRERAGAGLDETSIADIARLLDDEGFEVGRSSVGPFENVRGVMPGNEALYVLLEAGSNITTLSGQAACVPGDVNDELDRVKREQ